MLRCPADSSEVYSVNDVLLHSAALISRAHPALTLYIISPSMQPCLLW